jgi:hypothetical protein
MRARDASIRRRARREILAFGDGTRAAPSAPGVARHLLVAARAGRSAQRARTTQRARRALAAPRPRRSSARATSGKPTRAVRTTGAWMQREARRGRRARSRARASKRAREERDVKVMPRRAKRTCGVVGERAYALRARKCRGARGGLPSGFRSSSIPRHEKKRTAVAGPCAARTPRRTRRPPPRSPVKSRRRRARAR